MCDGGPSMGHSTRNDWDDDIKELTDIARMMLTRTDISENWIRESGLDLQRIERNLQKNR